MLEEVYCIEVNFSSVHHNYYSAWQYVTKEDESYEDSDQHPDLRNTPQPRTERASEETRRRAASTEDWEDADYSLCALLRNAYPGRLIDDSVLFTFR